MRTLTIARYALRRHLGSTGWQLALAGAAVLPSLAWVDPASGNAMLTVGGAPVAYDSAVLAAMYGASLMVWLGLAGFYIVRGNVAAAWASGMGSVLAALPVPGRSFVIGRWLGALAAVLALGLAMLLGVLAVHARYLAAPIDLLLYLRIWLPLLLPAAVFCTTMAMLCDAWRPLLGKAGALAYFLVWMACSFTMDAFWRRTGAAGNPLQLVDFAGHYSVLIELARVFHNTALGVEHSQFDPARAALAMPGAFWSRHAVGLRGASAALATLPLWLAVHYFHRYSPDLQRAARPSRWPVLGRLGRLAAPVQLLDRACMPLLRLVRPALDRAAARPGMAGTIGADVHYTVCLHPATLVLWLACVMAPLACAAEDLALVAPACLAAWGIVMADCVTRDAGGAALARTYPGGAAARMLRQVGAAFVLGGLFCLGLLAYWAGAAPGRAAVLVSGLLLASVVAQALGQLLGNNAHGARGIAAGLIGYLWVADRLREVPGLDTFALHGLAGLHAALVQLAIAAAGLFLLFRWHITR